MMANKPEKFSQDEIRRGPISPEELDSWVRYVRDVKCESIAEDEHKSVDEIDIRICIHLFYSLDKEGYADISVQTIRSSGFSAFYDIATFESIPDGQKTFEEYASFKNAGIVVRDDSFTAKRQINV